MKQFLFILFILILGFVGACQTEGEKGQEQDEKMGEVEDTVQRDLSGNTEAEVEGLKKIVPTGKDVKAVLSRYEDYKAAILVSNGKGAIEHIDQNSIDYYSDILNWALNSPKEEVQKLDPVNQFMVLSVRKRISREDVKKMKGKDLLIYTVDNEWTNKKTVGLTELGEIRKISDNTIRAAMTVRQEATETFIEFTRENKDAKWKINLLSLSENVNDQLARMANDRSEPVSDLIFDMIKQITNSKVSEDVWQPIK
ncbi:MAG: hypothetical protein ACPGVB_13060 [Chitinophagales bacterium]